MNKVTNRPIHSMDVKFQSINHKLDQNFVEIEKSMDTLFNANWIVAPETNINRCTVMKTVVKMTVKEDWTDRNETLVLQTEQTPTITMTEFVSF